MTKEEWDKTVDENPMGLSKEDLDFLKDHPRPDYANVPYQDDEPLFLPDTPYRPIGRRAGPNLGTTKQ